MNWQSGVDNTCDDDINLVRNIEKNVAESKIIRLKSTFNQQ